MICLKHHYEATNRYTQQDSIIVILFKLHRMKMEPAVLQLRIFYDVLHITTPLSLAHVVGNLSPATALFCTILYML